MGKARMYGMKSTFIPNSKADQMNKRFKRKTKAKQIAKLWNRRAEDGNTCL